MKMSETESFTCSVCAAVYRRHEHLRRHFASHSSQRPFKCAYCESGFKRRDVLRKHLKICSARIARDIAVPERMSAGKRMTSCNKCAQAKRACDRQIPCWSCAAKNQPCTYERRSPLMQAELRPLNDNAADLSYDFVDDTVLTTPLSSMTSTSLEWVDWDCSSQFLASQSLQGFATQDETSFDPFQLLDLSVLPQGSSDIYRSFDFLLNFTRASSLKKIFNYKRHRQHLLTLDVRRELGQNLAEPDQYFSQTPSKFNSSEISNPDCASRSRAARPIHASTPIPRLEPQTQKSGLAYMVECLDDPLFAQTKAIWDSFRVSRLRSAQNMPSSTADMVCADERCLQFFCPSNLRKFIDLFWGEWYPHCPIIHRPLFDIFHVPVMLLVPMTLLGAFMSSANEDAEFAKEWLEFAEELVFSVPVLSADVSERGVPDTDIPLSKIVQAAYFVCILLNWEGSDTMKRRVRHHRYAALVSAVREMGLSSANHFPRDYVNSCDFDWNAFIDREETIRGFTYVFLLDTAFIIFNNTPPRMVFHEMDFEMTTPEACFQAEKSSDCYAHWHAHLSKQLAMSMSSPLHLAEAISTLMTQGKFDEVSSRFTKMSTLNLFAIVAGIHTVLFQQRSLHSCLPTTLLPMRTALKRWQSAWDSRADTFTEVTYCEPWLETGFIGHAQEFAWLALARLDMLEPQMQSASNSTEGYMPVIKSESGRLDDTSMSLVTDLMLSLTVTGRTDSDGITANAMV